jgi:hypothetical protein
LGLSSHLAHCRDHWDLDVDLFQEEEMAVKDESGYQPSGNVFVAFMGLLILPFMFIWRENLDALIPCG